MWVCSRLTRAGATPSARYGSNASAKRGVQPRSSRVKGIENNSVGAVRERSRAALEPPLQFQPTAKNLCHAPCLGHAAARQEGLLRVEDLTELPDAGGLESLIEASEQVPQGRSVDAGKLQ